MKKSKSKVASKQKTSPQLPANYANVRIKAASERFKSASVVAQKISDLCVEYYLSGGERFIPLHPFVLVRVLPKDMVTDGGIILPNQKQNKPVHEGIVLETYRPYFEEVVLKEREHDGTYTEYIGKIKRECPLKIGQRVAYPHYEGVPHKYLGDDYVLVRQAADQIKFPYCQVLGVIDYEGDRKIGRKIQALMQKYMSVSTSGAAESRGAA